MTDWSWKYFIEELNAGDKGFQDNQHETFTDKLKAAHLEIPKMQKDIPQISARMLPKEKAHLQSIIKTSFSGYHSDPKKKAAVEHLMSIYAEFSRRSDITRRAHNAVVYRYMFKIPLSSKAVSNRLSVSTDSIYSYFSRVFNDLSVLVAGVKALPRDRKNKNHVDTILDYYLLLKLSLRVNPDQLTETLKPIHITGRQETRQALSGIESLIYCYQIFSEDFVPYEYIEKRQLSTLKDLYFQGMPLNSIAQKEEVTCDTCYKDLKKIKGRLTDLAASLVEIPNWSNGSSCHKPLACKYNRS